MRAENLRFRKSHRPPPCINLVQRLRDSLNLITMRPHSSSVTQIGSEEPICATPSPRGKAWRPAAAVPWEHNLSRPGLRRATLPKGEGFGRAEHLSLRGGQRPTWQSVLLSGLFPSWWCTKGDGLPHQSTDWFAMTEEVRKPLRLGGGLDPPLSVDLLQTK